LILTPTSIRSRASTTPSMAVRTRDSYLRGQLIEAVGSEEGH
jgi:hypothetical protein